MPTSNPSTNSFDPKFKQPDPSNGNELDRTRDIAAAYGISYEDYFRRKESSIHRSFDADIKTAQQFGSVSANEIGQWRLAYHELLEQLELQKDDVHDAAMWAN